MQKFPSGSSELKYYSIGTNKDIDFLFLNHALKIKLGLGVNATFHILYFFKEISKENQLNSPLSEKSNRTFLFIMPYDANLVSFFIVDIISVFLNVE